MSGVYASAGRTELKRKIGSWKRIRHTIACSYIGPVRWYTACSSSSNRRPPPPPSPPLPPPLPPSSPAVIDAYGAATSSSIINRLQSNVARSVPAHQNNPTRPSVGGERRRGGVGGVGGGGGGDGGDYGEGVTSTCLARRALPVHFPFSPWLPWAGSIPTSIIPKEAGAVAAAASSTFGKNAHPWTEQTTRVNDPSVDVNRYSFLRCPHVLSQCPLHRGVNWHILKGPSQRRWFASSSVTESRATTNGDEGRGSERAGSSPPSEMDGASIMIDRSGLCQPMEHSHGPSAEMGSGKQLTGPMSKHIESLIRFRGGPITVAEYMEEVLTNPKAGYYMNRDVFGTHGDFVTSPDVSQMFGELLGIWTVCLWQQMGCPNRMRLVELGPGRGTLMADLLRGTSQFEPFAAALSIHLVECSPALRQLQWKAMRCRQSAQTLMSDDSPISTGTPQQETGAVEPNSVAADQAGISAISRVPVSWHLQLEDIPKGDPTIVIAHEFFDALPVHQFQMTERGWCETLVDVAQQPRDQEFRFVHSPRTTPASSLYLNRRLMGMCPEERKHHKQIEVCPAGMKLAAELATRVGEDGGAALIIDYGENHAMADTLQAIRKHEFVNVLQAPGLADLSAYVDFEALRQAVQSSGANAVAFGPITQAELLGKLGINSRLEALLQHANEKQVASLQQGYWRLVGESSQRSGMPKADGDEDTTPDRWKQYEGMGTRYKAMAIVSRALSGPPICFEDDE